MNSNYGKGSSNGSTNTFNFDLGLGSNRSKPLNDMRNQNSSGYSSFSYSSSTTSTAQPRPAFQPGKPSWTHQPAAASQPARSGLLDGPNSMVGDIFGKTWSSTGPAKASGIGIGIAEKNPNLFGDLVSSALGQGNKGSSTAPLKNATPATSKSAYSMGNVADSLPKVGNPVQSGAGWGSNGSFGGSSGGYNRNVSNATASNVGSNANKSSSIGGTSMKGMASGGGMMSGNKDPFVSLVDFSSKPQSGNLNSGPKGKKVNAGVNDAFGDFQNASKPSSTSVPSPGASNGDFFGSSMGTSSNMADFGMPSNNFGSQKQSSVPTSSDDPLGMFFNSSSGSAAPASAATGGTAGQQFSELDDWGVDSGFGGGAEDAGGSTTELEGLPPPPAGVSASSAKNKGADHQKNGQYADAIKWLSWAVVLLEKTNDKALTVEVLSTRASCYKEVGEYKKAVADCSKVLEGDEANVSVLVQRALLYESMEKYRLGAEDLRAVLKIDPMNRIARSTVHRLSKMAE